MEQQGMGEETHVRRKSSCNPHLRMPYSNSYRFMHRSKQPWRSRILQIVSHFITKHPVGNHFTSRMFCFYSIWTFIWKNILNFESIDRK
jgi:hypothetical protein